MKFRSAMIQVDSFGLVTKSKRLLLRTLSHILTKAKIKISLKISFSTFVFAANCLLTTISIMGSYRASDQNRGSTNLFYIETVGQH